ncbi:MAG: glycosyltransferase [Candidatus Hydrogenedentes bacterium]|nr:glycosyltransferase [Candidatus Hydrogenedentota bacterium]
MSPDVKKAQICFVIPSLAPGGTERQLLYLLEGLRPVYECTVICTRDEGAWASAAQDAGATVLAMHTFGGWDLRIKPRAARIFRAKRPQIMHTFLFGLDLAVNRAARRAGVPILISSRRELAAWMKPRHVRTQRRANELVDCIVANSHAVADFAIQQEETDRNAFRVIHNGIDIDSFRPQQVREEIRKQFGIAPNKKIVGMVANFSAVKDHPLFLAMATLLIARRDDMHFLLLGSGPNREPIEAVIRAEKMEPFFTVTANERDIASFIATMDVCVHTSRREGFPNALMEAMALALPIVASRVGGVPELIEDGRSGLLVSSRRPEDFAAAVLRCLDESTFAKTLGASARERIRSQFTMDRMVESYRALYDEMLRRLELRR